MRRIRQDAVRRITSAFANPSDPRSDTDAAAGELIRERTAGCRKMLPEMRMVKQGPDTNECGACVVAMLTGRTKEEILAEVADPEKPDYFWLNYMQALGFVLDDVRDDPGFDRTFAWDGMFNGYLRLPWGDRYYSSVRVAKAVHAVAIDESGMVFDPSTSAPMLGTCTFSDYLHSNQRAFGTVAIGCCYRVREKGFSDEKLAPPIEIPPELHSQVYGWYGQSRSRVSAIRQ